jgi:uncharacterized membrane protein
MRSARGTESRWPPCSPHSPALAVPTVLLFRERLTRTQVAGVVAIAIGVTALSA